MDADELEWMSDTWGGGGYDWLGMPQELPQEAPAYSPPAAPYYSPADFAPGSGAYSVGGGDWQGVQSFPAAAPVSPSVPTGSYYPYSVAGRSDPTDMYLAGRQADSSRAWQNHGASSISTPMYPQPMGGGGYRGGSSGGSNPTQFISLGQPERTLYDRYKGLLMDPSSMASDPAYKFMYNQGLQALNRSLAAKRQTLSGKAINDSLDYGAGMTAKYMQDLLPQYRGGAQEELARFMGPAGLLPGYAASNRVAQNSAEFGGGNPSTDNSAFYHSLLKGLGDDGESSGTGNIGFGGLQSSYNPVSYQASPRNGLSQRPVNYSANMYDEFTDAADNIY